MEEIRMTIRRKLVLLVLLYFIGLKTGVNSDISVSPNNLTVLEGNNATIRCSYQSQDSAVQGVIFIVNNVHVVHVFDTNCSNVFTVNSSFAIQCENTTSFTLTWTKLKWSDHASKVSCRIHHNGTSELAKTKATIYVNVPIISVNISNNSTDRIENTVEAINSTLRCETSESRPAASISWKRITASGTVADLIEDQMTVNIAYTERETMKHLKIVQSSLVIKPTRNDGNISIYCEATNGQSVIRTDHVTLYVQYPPDQPRFTINKTFVNERVRFIVGKNLSVACLSFSNPIPTYSWQPSGIGGASNQHLTISNVQQNGTYTCTVINTMMLSNKTEIEGKSSTPLTIHILFPPSKPTFKFSNTWNGSVIENATLFAIRNDTLKITCISNGDPIPSYKWMENMEKGDLLELNSIQMKTSKTCIASNEMNETVGISRIGSSNATLEIIVTYPPGKPYFKLKKYNESNDIVETLYDNETCIIVEHSSLSVMCKADGYPSPTYRWYLPNNKTLTDLNMVNISKAEAGLYKCIAMNVIKRSFPPITNSTQSTAYVYLDVQYKSSVETFVIEGKRNGSIVDVDEHENVRFNCRVDSNPNSTVSLIFKGKEISQGMNINVLTHNHSVSSCLDNGLYSCLGQNNYNNKPSSKSLMLRVRCTPQASPDYVLKTNLTSPQNVSVTFDFTALAYPVPEFKWFRFNNSIWNNMSTNSNISIKFENLRSNLTIKNVTENDYGLYKLKLQNTVGSFEQVFALNPYGKPDPPILFEHLSQMVTETTSTLQWIPGFNGGPAQTFILRYAPEKNKYWTIVSLPDAGETLMIYTLKGLASGSSYIVELFSLNSVGQSLTLGLTIQTKELIVKAVGSHENVIYIVVGCMACGSVILIVVGTYYFRKRKKNNPAHGCVYQNMPFNATHMHVIKRGKKMALRETDCGSLQELDDVHELYSEPTEYYNTAEKIDNIVRIKVSELFDYVLDRTIDSFSLSFQKLPTALQKPCIFARRPENIALNRYNGIFPYDHSRVKIESQPEFFINACYIDGYKRRKAYIASLGPTAKTTNEFITFWKMVWHEESNIIVMLTNLEEPSGMKCEQYWPKGDGDKTFGDIRVSSQNIEAFAEYTVRSFSISKDDELRTLYHLHFTAWPDKKVPEDVTSLTEFRQRFKATPSALNGPVIVHCSAGIGRTGTFIALDRLIEEGQSEGSVNVFDCVSSMREQRVKMVQTNEQYIFIYKALVNVLAFDCGPIPVESFSEFVDTTNNNTYSSQYQHLKQSIEKETKEVVNARAKNEKLASENRHGADIPGDQNCVHLYLDRSSDDSDYINAVYVNSFKEKDHFILAQSPLPSRALEFVCMIYQENCSCIVTMDNLNLKESRMEVGIYLPADDQTLDIGCYTVSCTKHDTKPQYTVRKVKIKNNGNVSKGEKISYHFQYNKWKAVNDIPENAKDFVDFVKEVEEYSGQLGEKTSHVLVHCLEANQRSGLFCAVTIVMEKIRYERQVNVLNTLRRLRTRRRSAITSMEQLKFCYQATNAYINM